MRMPIATFAPDHELLTMEHEQPELIALTVGGVVHAGVLGGSFAMSVHTVNQERMIVLALTIPERGTALYQPFDPDSARSLAAHLCKCADQIDGGKAKQ